MKENKIINKKNFKNLVAASLLIIPSVILVSNNNVQKANAMLGNAMRGAINKMGLNKIKIIKPNGLKMNTQTIKPSTGAPKGYDYLAKAHGGKFDKTKLNKTVVTSNGLTHSHSLKPTRPAPPPPIKTTMKSESFSGTKSTPIVTTTSNDPKGQLPPIALSLKQTLADFEAGRTQNKLSPKNPNPQTGPAQINLYSSNIDDMGKGITGIVNNFELSRKSQTLGSIGTTNSSVLTSRGSNTLPNLTPRN